MDNTITKVFENISLYAQSLKDHKLIVKQTVELTERVYFLDEKGKEHFYHKKSVKRTNSIVEYPLMEISVTEVQNLRKSDKPIFLYKENNALYYTEMPARLHSVELLAGSHQCASVNNDCVRLSAESDANGGCRKVRDRYLRIENYDFIKKGYQVINTTNNCLVVLECSNFKAIPAREIRNKDLANTLAATNMLLKRLRNMDNDDDDDIFPRFHR